MRRNLIIMAAIALIAASSGYFAAMVIDFARYDAREPARSAGPGTVALPSPEDVIGRRNPQFVLEDQAGEPVSSSEFAGRVWLVNFWATWCAPCVEEMPMLSGLQSEYGERDFRVVGIAVDDPERAREFADGMELDYTLLYGLSGSAVAMREFGNRAGALPYSALIDREGIIRWTNLGAVRREELEARLRELM